MLCISCFRQVNDVLCCFGVIPLILMGIDVLHSMNYFQMEVVLTVSGGET